MTAGTRALVDYPGDQLHGMPVTFLGFSAGYPWVRDDDGKTFVWLPKWLRRAPAVQLALTNLLT